jgi:S-adenosyl-L-methionine hydrolase (adenosine-forming)
MGDTDHYVASVKAAILSHNPEAHLVDITHKVRSFDIYGAALILRSVWKQFPIGTVHVIGLLPELTSRTPHVALAYMGHFFVGADNGIFSVLLDEEPEDVFEINLPQGEEWTFPMKGVFATAAAHLSKGGPISFLGKKTSGVQQLFPMEALVEPDGIKGMVIHIDYYGNVYTSITRDLFVSARRGRPFSINFKRAGYALTTISSYFSDVLEGERLAMWASNGHLMIAIHKGSTDQGGSAASLFGFQLNDPIRIEFYGDSISETDL